MNPLPDSPAKEAVRAHWEAESCGVRYGAGEAGAEFYRTIEAERYRLEPYIPAFADFAAYRGKPVLEIGIGAGTDFEQWVRAGALATGVDLTHAGVDHTIRRLGLAGFDSASFSVRQADTEALPFPDASFALVYSWGVLHHTPDAARAFREAQRVLQPGGALKAMVYHVNSWTAWMLWATHGLARLRPFRSPRRVMFERLESPGTKAYTKSEARDLVVAAGFTEVRVWTVLGPGDLLNVRPSAKYQGTAWRLIWRLYPRWLVRLLGNRFGLYLLIEANRPASGPSPL